MNAVPDAAPVRRDRSRATSRVALAHAARRAAAAIEVRLREVIDAATWGAPGADPGRYVLNLSTTEDPRRIVAHWRWVPDAEPSEWGPAPEEER